MTAKTPPERAYWWVDPDEFRWADDDVVLEAARVESSRWRRLLGKLKG